jgi:putative transposase
VAFNQFDLSELLDALRAGGDIDLIRESVEMVLQALIDAEATTIIGAAPHERTETRTNQRNGTRPRLLATKAGDVNLAIPKLRHGSFFPSVLDRRRRIDRALYAVVMESYVHGVSTRKVDDLVAALGAASGISKSEVSRICAELDETLSAFRDRPLGHIEFPYVFLDATYIKARAGGRIVSKAVIVATGVSRNGDREVLGVEVGDSEDGAFWIAFLRSLKARKLGGVQLVISDAHTGLREAISAVMHGATWQRCKVHLARNVLAKVPKASQDMVAAAMRTIYAQPDAERVHRQFDEMVTMLERQFADAARILAAARDDVLAFSTFPEAHWRKIWSTNPLERLNAEIKRRTRVVGIFPNDAAVLRLVTAVVAETHDEWQVAERRYLAEGTMARLYDITPTIEPAEVLPAKIAS